MYHKFTCDNFITIIKKFYKMKKKGLTEISKISFNKIKISKLNDLNKIKGGNNNGTVIDCDDTGDTGMGDVSEN